MSDPNVNGQAGGSRKRELHRFKDNSEQAKLRCVSAAQGTGTHTVLTTTPGTVQDDTAVIIGHYINPAAAKRSGLLSGIASASGRATLPESISPEDVQLWQAACILEDQPSTDELMTILKVWWFPSSCSARTCLRDHERGAPRTPHPATLLRELVHKNDLSGKSGGIPYRYTYVLFSAM